MTRIDKLLAVAMHPDRYGDSIEIKQLQNGALTICPLNDDEPGCDETRRIVLDEGQVVRLKSILHMDPSEAATKVAAMLMERRDMARKSKPTQQEKETAGRRLIMAVFWLAVGSGITMWLG